MALSELGCVFVKLSIYWDFFMAISSVYRDRSEKEGEKHRASSSFWVKKPSWWKRSEENVQSWQEGNNNSNNHFLQPSNAAELLWTYSTLNLEDGLQQQNTPRATPVNIKLKLQPITPSCIISSGSGWGYVVIFLPYFGLLSTNWTSFKCHLSVLRIMSIPLCPTAYPPSDGCFL